MEPDIEDLEFYEQDIDIAIQLFAHNTGFTSLPDFYGIDHEHQDDLLEKLEHEKLSDKESYAIVEEWLKSENNIHTPLYKCSACGESYYKMKVNFLLINFLSSLKLNELKLIKYNKLSDELKKSWNVFNFNHLNNSELNYSTSVSNSPNKEDIYIYILM